MAEMFGSETGVRLAPRRNVLCTALFLCMAVFAFRQWVLWPVVISGESMAPNYRDGQPNYINKLAYLSHAPQRGDVVGVRVAPNDYLIKRIIGTPGDRIEFYRGTVIVNGQPLKEPYVQRPLIWWLDPVQLGPNEFFIMGDNRTYSTLGAIAKNDILGKALF
ncbi:MAG TPA: signal peptidase I [Candidatus Acidoferrum sp.]|nr:signal peptidase I [Candidatus Acidoferrum sp.]